MNDREPIRLYSKDGQWEYVSEELPTSLSLGDPTLHEVLQWHQSICSHCILGSKLNPPLFGRPDNRKCVEYYEIVQEYSEYEATYIRQGNP